MSENSRRCTMGSRDPSNRAICGILNLSGSVTAVSVYPSSMSGMDFTPWDFLNSFSSLFSFNAVGATSNSKGESGRLVGVLDSWGKIGAEPTPLECPYLPGHLVFLRVSEPLVGEELDAKQRLCFAVAAWGLAQLAGP